jgi:hypothetical protein
LSSFVAGSDRRAERLGADAVADVVADAVVSAIIGVVADAVASAVVGAVAGAVVDVCSTSDGGVDGSRIQWMK